MSKKAKHSSLEMLRFLKFARRSLRAFANLQEFLGAHQEIHVYSN